MNVQRQDGSLPLGKRSRPALSATAAVTSALLVSSCSSWSPSFDTSWIPRLDTSAVSGSALRLDSDPPGAEARTSLGQACRTPCTLTVPISGDFTVTFTLAGFVPVSVPVEVARNSGVRWDVDASPPPAFDPNPIEVALEPAPPPPTGRRKPPRQRPPARTAPG
jgi:hypothetical protein